MSTGFDLKGAAWVEYQDRIRDPKPRREMAIEIDKSLIRDDEGVIRVGEAKKIAISPEEANNVNLYSTFDDVNKIDQTLYNDDEVKRGLRNSDGTGVFAGITNISNVHGYTMENGKKIPEEGSVRFRGYDLYDLLSDSSSGKRFRFEELTYLLLIGELPTRSDLQRFISAIDSQRELPDGFTASMLMRDAAPDIMNVLARSVLQLYAYDNHAEERTPEHEIHTAISLISRLPRIMVLSYYSKRAKYNHESMIMHRFIEGQSTAETILSMLRPDRRFSEDEANMLDIMLCLQAEHGGGNNSTFATRVITSSDTDPYSAYSAAIGALKGYRHGGANHKVRAMHSEIKANIPESKWDDEDAVADYLAKIVRKEAYDRTGLVYGMGHAVYTLSDPRAVICKRFARELAENSEFEQEFKLLETIEKVTQDVVSGERGVTKTLCANVDMYSGFVYSMIGIPEDLYTPLFACARMAGWSAHRFEEIVSGRRIIRPAYKNTIEDTLSYSDIEDR